MDERILEEVLTDQKNEMAELMKTNFVYRREEDQVQLDSRLAQVVIGVRRSGKSTLCCSVLKKSGVHFAYVNFDDELLSAPQNRAYINTLVKTFWRPTSRVTIK